VEVKKGERKGEREKEREREREKRKRSQKDGERSLVHSFLDFSRFIEFKFFFKKKITKDLYLLN
jgi:hypothetical protein